MDRSDNRSRRRAPRRAKPSPVSRGEGWMLEAMHHLLDTATADWRA